VDWTEMCLGISPELYWAWFERGLPSSLCVRYSKTNVINQLVRTY
jgi:hypothetical protein